MEKQTVSKLPESFRARINKGDQKIGYIARRIEEWKGKSLSVSDIKDVLFMSHEYDKEREENGDS